MDIAFSDHHLSKKSLGDLGKVIEAIRTVTTDDELSFWTFIRYVSVNHKSILGVELKPELQRKCDTILNQVDLPEVTIDPGRQEAGETKSPSKRWWQFWKR